MQTINKGGDVLARGGVKNQFPPAGGGVTQEKWDSIFADFNLDEYKKDSRDEERSSDAGSQETGVSSSEFGAAETDEPITR